MPFLTTRVRRAFDVLLGRSYEAAAGGRRWQGAGEMAVQRAAIIAARGPAARRARYLVGNNALAASGAEAWTSALVGTGLKPQSSHPDAGVREALNAQWEAWTDVADADGRTDFYGVQALAAKRMVIDGECFALMTNEAEGFRVRLLDAEQVDSALHRELGDGRRIAAGVELDAAGRRAAYHVLREKPGLPLTSPLAAIRVAADDMAHLFRPEVPGQLRGLSWFAPVLLRQHEHDQAVDAQLVRQKVAAMMVAFVVDPNGDGLGLSGRDAADGALEAGLEPGTILNLGPGKDVRNSDPAKVGAEVIDFLKVTSREIAAGLGVPYESLTGDLSDVNYSSIRAGLVQFRRRVEALQHNVLVFQFCRPVWRRFVTTAVLSGDLDAPGFERDPEPYLAARWITPRTEWVDPAKDVEAELSAIAGGLMSRRQAVAGRGYDLEALDAEIAADKARAEGLGLDFNRLKPAEVAA